MLCSANTKVRGRFSKIRCGPSRRGARNASAALENFVCYPQKTFSRAPFARRNIARQAWHLSRCKEEPKPGGYGEAGVSARQWQHLPDAATIVHRRRQRGKYILSIVSPLELSVSAVYTANPSERGRHQHRRRVHSIATSETSWPRLTPLTGAKKTSRRKAATSVFDPSRKWTVGRSEIQ